MLSTVTYNDHGEVRPIIYRLSLSEMVVPYGAPEYPHPRKFAFDSYVPSCTRLFAVLTTVNSSGEYGMGTMVTCHLIHNLTVRANTIVNPNRQTIFLWDVTALVRYIILYVYTSHSKAPSHSAKLTSLISPEHTSRIQDLQS